MLKKSIQQDEPNKVGRPITKGKGEAKRSHTLSLSDNDKLYIVGKYSSLSAAIRLLTKGGKYEEQAEQIELLTAKLKNLTK